MVRRRFRAEIISLNLMKYFVQTPKCVLGTSKTPLIIIIRSTIIKNVFLKKKERLQQF